MQETLLTNNFSKQRIISPGGGQAVWCRVAGGAARPHILKGEQNDRAKVFWQSICRILAGDGGVLPAVVSERGGGAIQSGSFGFKSSRCGAGAGSESCESLGNRLRPGGALLGL